MMERMKSPEKAHGNCHALSHKKLQKEAADSSTEQ
jgi:hypothetical protein